jgi:hypothetical protein
MILDPIPFFLDLKKFGFRSGRRNKTKTEDCPRTKNEDSNKTKNSTGI